MCVEGGARLMTVFLQYKKINSISIAQSKIDLLNSHIFEGQSCWFYEVIDYTSIIVVACCTFSHWFIGYMHHLWRMDSNPKYRILILSLSLLKVQILQTKLRFTAPSFQGPLYFDEVSGGARSSGRFLPGRYAQSDGIQHQTR